MTGGLQSPEGTITAPEHLLPSPPLAGESILATWAGLRLH